MRSRPCDVTAPVRLLRTPALLVPLATAVPLLSTACFDPTLVGDPGGAGAPTAVLSVSATGGQAPLDVVLDASASTPFTEGTKLVFDFDVDGDGTFEAERQEEPTFRHTYTTGGDVTALVRVRGEDGRYDVDEETIAVTAPNPPRTADVDVDSDNDGNVTGADEAVEDRRRAAFFGNVDDDDGDGRRDRDDSVVDAEDDDLAPVIVRRARDLGAGKVFVEVSPAIAAERTRLWQGDRVVTSAGNDRGEVVGAGDGDVELRLEALTGRTGDWDGVVTVTVTVEDGTGATQGSVLSEDSVQLRAAPVIFPDNLQDPRRLFVMDVRDGGDNNQALIAAFESGLPDDVELYTLSDQRYFYDRWVQDSWEVGTQVVADGNGGVKEMITAMQTERAYGGQGLDAFVPNEWIGANRGFYYPGGAESGHNYGGNLEVSPPTSADPFGRMLYGGGTTTLSGARNVDTMNENQVSFLNAQEIQGPAVELSSEWLAVGHIDEIFQFVPDLGASGAHPFKVVIASPALARDVLLDAQQRGHGDALVFPTRRGSYAVDEILAAEDFLATNELAQARIDSVQARLMSELGLVDDDFRRVPVLFNEIDGSGLVAAFNPGIQNLVTVRDRLFVPDPEGPVVDGVDLWQQATLDALVDTDLDVRFVDVFESYHELLGEAHCGTNLERAPYATAWWTKE